MCNPEAGGVEVGGGAVHVQQMKENKAMKI